MPKVPEAPPGTRFVDSELVGDIATFTYEDRKGNRTTVMRNAIIIGTKMTCFVAIIEFARECTIISDIEDGCGLWLGDHKTLVEFGLREEVLDCRTETIPPFNAM